MTTILSVRRGNTVVLGGDGQVSLGNTVMKGNARKVRRMHNDPKHSARAVRSAVYKDQRFSDHAPLTVDYDHPHRR